MTFELFIGLLPAPKGCSASVALTPQNFGIVDLGHHFAIYNPAGGGPLDGLHRVAVQGITETVTEDQTPVINSPEEKGDKENGGEKPLDPCLFLQIPFSYFPHKTETQGQVPFVP